jgi:sugar phosphate isomerase/epimerase
MSRNQLCFILAAFALSSPLPAAEPATLKNPFYAMDTAGGDVKLLKELGYAGQSGTLGGSAEDVARQAGTLEKEGLKLYAVYVGCRLSKDGLTVPEALPALFKALKGRDTLIWLHIGGQGLKPSDAAGDTVAVPALQKVADQAAENGLRVAIYPHVGEWTERFQDAVRVACKVGRKNFGVCFNLCHCLAVGDEKRIPELLKDAKPLLFMVTLNGADANARGWDHLIQPLGQGTFDVAGVLKLLREIGYNGPIGFQGYGIKGDRRELLTKTMAGWKKLAATK